MDNLFLKEDYNLKREKVLSSYKQNMVDYLKHLYPNADNNKIEEEVKNIINENMKVPVVEYNDCSVAGTSITKKAPLTRFLSDNVKDKIFSMFGVIYERSEIMESFLKKTIKTKIKERNQYKRAMFEATDDVISMMYNIKQSITKIFMNSIIGSMDNEYSVICDKDGFNSVTSISRHCVKYGYVHVERLVSGNLFLLNMDDVIQYCIQLCKHLPSNIGEVCKKYDLYTPTSEDVVSWLKTNLLKYNRDFKTIELERFVGSLSRDELCYIFYASNLKHIFFFNKDFFKSFIDDFFKTEVEPLKTDIKDFKFKEYDETLLNTLKLIHTDLIGKNPETKHVYSYSEALIHNPDGLAKFAACVVHAQNMITSFKDFIQCFLVMNNDFVNITNHNRMMRSTVIQSDTDSVIFTLISMVRWYSGKIYLSDEGLKINSFVVYLISKTLENVFARQSRLFGASEEDQNLINMKNEFFYPVMMTTPIKKTYAGLVYSQEGNILPKLKTDIKGVAFKSSNLSGEVINLTKDLINTVLDKSMTDGKLDTNRLLTNVSDFEYEIYYSYQNNKLGNYLAISSLKPKEQYKDPDISLYRYYELWEEIFAQKYGNIFIPSKVFCIPIKNQGAYIKSEEYLSWLKQNSPTIYQKLVSYMQRDSRKITRMIFPMNIDIPAEIYKLIHVRFLIYTNCKPMYLVLNGLNLSYAYQNNSKTKTILVSDYYRSEKYKDVTIE